MEEIEFRAFVPSLGGYFKSTIDLKVNPEGIYTIESGNIFIMEQYTTGKDKNGKEIYKNDIVKLDDYIGLIEWDNKSLCWMVTWINDYKSEMIEDKNKFEVIGNVHENPELWIEVRSV